jgi:hypothetical protein
MWIAYLTTDEVNWNLAWQMAEDCGLSLELLSFRDPPPAGQVEAVLYDLDSFPQPERQEVLAKLLATISLSPVVVHSYHLEEEQISGLRRNGVAVHTHFGKAIFLKLALRRAECPRLERVGS